MSRNLYQLKILAELFKRQHTRTLIEVGCDADYIGLVAASMGWTVLACEMNYNNYHKLTRTIQANQVEQKITPIYTRIGLRPALDHLIGQQTIGLVKINVNHNILEIVEGLKSSLEHQQIENLLFKVLPRSQPINLWIDVILSLVRLHFQVFDVQQPQIHRGDTSVKLCPFDISQLHQLEETTLLFMRRS